MMRTKRLSFVLILAISLGIIFSLKVIDFQIRKHKRQIAYGKLKEAIEDEIINFKGKVGIIIKDLDMNLEISVNKDKLFPSASLVKIPIMAACFDAIDKGKIQSDSLLLLKSHHKVPGSGELKHEPQGAQFNIKQLIELMISESDNTACNMLIELLGFDYLNESFERLGLRDTNISRSMMDFKSREEGRENYTTSSDLAFLLDKIYHYRLINKRTSYKCLELLKRQKIKDRIPAKLPPELTVAHKTGLEKGICHDAGIIFTDRGSLLICVLTKHRYKNARPAKRLISRIAFLAYKHYRGF